MHPVSLRGARRVPAIAVDGIPGDLITPDDNDKNLAQAWEEEADRWASVESQHLISVRVSFSTRFACLE